MATEKRLIDANALYDIVERKCKTTYGYFLPIYRWFADKVANAPTVDAVEVVRCGDYEKCHPWTAQNGETGYECDYYAEDVEPDGFCCHGIRRNSGNKT